MTFKYRQPGFLLSVLIYFLSFLFNPQTFSFLCLHDTFHSVDVPLSRVSADVETKRCLIRQKKIKSDAHYIIAAIESKYFYICIFFYKIFRHCLDIIFSCARDIRFPVSQLWWIHLFFFSLVFCCVCVCMRVFFLFLSRLRLHLNEQWHGMLHVCVCLLLKNAKNIFKDLRLMAFMFFLVFILFFV